MSGAGERKRWDFEGLHRRRPRLESPVLSGALLGFHAVRQEFADRLATAEGTSLLALVGRAGAGKSALLSTLSEMTEANVVSVGRVLEDLDVMLDRDGANVGRLVHALRERAGDRGVPFVVTYDDVDHDLLPNGTLRFVRQLVQTVDVRLIVITASTTPDTGQLPVPVKVIGLDHRHASENEFAQYLERALENLRVPIQALGDDVAHALFALQEQTADFRSVVYVVEMLAAVHRLMGAPLSIGTLRRILDDPHLGAFHTFPGVSSTAGGRRLSFHRKDKTELLCDVLMRAYETPGNFAQGAAALPGFDRAEFVADAQASYRDALMAFCLTRSPVDIIEKLLRPTDVSREIEALELNRSQVSDDPEKFKRLLIRGLGFTFVDRPIGLEDYAKRVDATQGTILAGSQQPEVVKGSGLTLVQTIESLLLDLLEFWGTHLFGSVAAVVNLYNRHSDGKPIRADRKTVGDVLALLRFIDERSGSPDRALGLALVDKERPLSDEFLRLAGSFVQGRNRLVHVAPGEDESAVSTNVRELFDVACSLVDEAKVAKAYPAVIKITEIVFDEYGRKIFTGMDSSGAEVRFSETDMDREESILVASHYYMLPRKRVAVNPVLVPTVGSSSRVLFEWAESYDSSSGTQRSQGQLLLDRIEIRGGERILDAGCGGGTLTLELAASAPGVHVHAVDISPDMVRLATEHAERADVHNVSFEAVDIADLETDERYDLVFSNATMHWVLPPERGYQRLFEALTPGGRLAVHQGGEGCYRGLRQHALDLLSSHDLLGHFANWRYPVYYPSKDELEELLQRLGFVEISVDSVESDGRELPNLIRDFSHAGLLPYLMRLPEPQREPFRREFIATAERAGVNTYTHRLLALARRP